MNATRRDEINQTLYNQEKKIEQVFKMVSAAKAATSRDLLLRYNNVHTPILSMSALRHYLIKLEQRHMITKRLIGGHKSRDNIIWSPVD